MVCSKVDTDNEISMHSGADKRASESREVDILTPEGKTLKMHLEENTEIGKVKNECELLCGIPSDLQVIQLQGRDLCNDSTLSSLEMSDGCTLKITVPQWWQKFISTCYKGDTQQVRKRIYVKMSQVSREERSFTAAFIAAIKGNHNLMFAAFAGRQINLHSKTKLSGRNLLHAAVSGGSTSCVANILMNGGNALLEAPDNTGETPVRMAEKLYGESGDMVKFLNVYLELHRRDTNHSRSSNRYWDNLEENNNNSVVISVDNEGSNDDENRSHPNDNLITDFRDLNIGQDELSRTNFTETQLFNNKCNQGIPSVSNVNIEDYDDKTGHNSLVVTSNGSSKPDERQVSNDNPISVICSEQGNGQASDTGYYSSGNPSVGKDGTGMFWNGDLFTQKDTPSTDSEITKQELNLGEQIRVNQDEDNANSLSTFSADQSTDSGSGRGPKPRRRAQLRFLEQKRKRSTTERPNLEQLMMMRYDSVDKESHEHKNEESDKEQSTVLRDKDSHAVTSGDVVNVCQGEEPVPTVTISANHDSSDKCPSPKPLRRAQLRKKSIVEQRRRRSVAMVQRPNIEELDTGERNVEGSDHLERNSEDTNKGLLEQKDEDNTNKNLKQNPGNTTCGGFGHNPVDNHSDNFERKNSAVNFTQHTEGHKTAELQEDESPVSAKYVLRLWQDQAHEAEVAALSGDESDTGRSPKVLRRAFIRKQVFMEERRRKSATERPDVLKLIRRNVEEDENASQDANEIASEDTREDKPSMAESDLSAATVDHANAVGSDVPAVIGGNGFSMKDKETPELPSQLPPSEQSKERIPIRRAQRWSNTGPLLDTRPNGSRSNSWSSMSGEESEGSDDEKKVVAEIVAPIGRLAKTQRRRRLPLLPNKRIKLPLIRIEDSGISRRSAAIKAPHPPLGRSRSGSTCSDDSVSSVEMCSERTR